MSEMGGGGGQFDFMSTHPANKKRIKVSHERRRCRVSGASRLFQLGAFMISLWSARPLGPRLQSHIPWLTRRRLSERNCLW